MGLKWKPDWLEKQLLFSIQKFSLECANRKSAFLILSNFDPTLFLNDFHYSEKIGNITTQLRKEKVDSHLVIQKT